MELSAHSKNRLLGTMDQWSVNTDFATPIYNYLVYGFEPGSCFTGVLANDFISAISSSHPANTVEAFKSLANWMVNCMPQQAYGSYRAVSQWVNMESDQRRKILESHGLIYTAKEETWLTIKEGPVREVMLY